MSDVRPHKSVTDPRPNPWIRQRTAWYGRHTLALNLAILTAGLLLLCMSLPQREAVFAPGPLSRTHSQLQGNHLLADRCSQCHPNSHTAQAGNPLQDELCLKCHARHLPQAHRRSPHDLSRGALIKLTAKWQVAGTSSGAQASARATEHAEEQMFNATSCAMCHVEHHGADFELTAISDASCQACHQRQFSSLTVGHPPFESYPYRQPRRLAFDHSSHQQKHFGTKSEEFQCARCHADQQPAGQIKGVRRGVSFEQACASCHQAPLESSISGGWAVLQLPSIDASAASTPAAELPSWPRAARFGYVGEISVPMRLLLLADPHVRSALTQLPASGQLEDIPAEGPLRGQVTRSLAAGLRRLIGEVASEGHAAWQRRLTTTATFLLARELAPSETELIHVLSQGIPPDLFRQMEYHWFGQHSLLATTDAGATRDADATRDAALLRLASPTLESDNLLPEAGGLPDQPTDLLDDLPADALPLGGESGVTDDALLLEPLSAMSQPPQSERPNPAKQSATAKQLDPAEQSQARSQTNQFPQLRGDLHVAAGGWYLDHQLLALRYMPIGHADPTLAAWAEFVALLDAAQQFHGDGRPTGHTISLAVAEANPAEHVPDESHAAEFAQVTRGSTLPGGCTQCHLLASAQLLGKLQGNWNAQQPSTARQFTKFDHTPHLTLPALSDCSHCHVLQNTRENRLGEYLQTAARDSWTVAPNEVTNNIRQLLSHEFSGMRLEQCVACHRPGGANDACIQCHNYHVDAVTGP